MKYESEKQVAIAISHTVAILCEQIRHQYAVTTLHKGDTSPVTVADFSTQAIICQALEAKFPDDPVIAEEDAALLTQQGTEGVLNGVIEQVQTVLPDASPLDVIGWINRGNGQIARRYWTLDPIDGTKGYLRGDQYAIALALVVEGVVELGLLCCPAFPFDSGKNQASGTIFVGVRGEGSYMLSLQDKCQILLKIPQKLGNTPINRIESVEYRHSDRHQQIALDQALGITQSPQQMDSLAKYGAIAQGKADFYVRIPLREKPNHKENIWDHAAGVVIVEEAGGKVTDLDGIPLDFSVGAKLSNNRGILVSNGQIHTQVLEAIAQIGA